MLRGQLREWGKNRYTYATYYSDLMKLQMQLTLLERKMKRGH